MAKDPWMGQVCFGGKATRTPSRMVVLMPRPTRRWVACRHQATTMAGHARMPPCRVAGQRVGVVPMSRRISDEQVDRAIELLRSGIGPGAVAEAAGMSEVTLYAHLRRRGLTTEGAPKRAGDQR